VCVFVVVVHADISTNDFSVLYQVLLLFVCYMKSNAISWCDSGQEILNHLTNHTLIT